MALHQPIERALGLLLEPLDLAHETDSFVSVDASELVALTSPVADPFAALVSLQGDIQLPPALIVAEPGVCTRVLNSLWRSARNEGAPLTQVEGELLRGFLADVVREWRRAWRAEQIAVTPNLALAGTLSQVRGQVVPGQWYVARTVVRELDGSTVGTLLFSYPAASLPRLAAERDRIRWRSRLRRGLSDLEREHLRNRLGTQLRDLRISLPVTLRTELSLGVLNSLERGDVVTFEAGVDGFDLTLLDAPVTAQLARSNDRLALVLTGPGTDTGSAAYGDDDPFANFDDDDDPYNAGELQ
jgi:hypothetical protein